MMVVIDSSGEGDKMEFAEIAYASDETLAKVDKPRVARRGSVTGPWATVKPGSVILINGKRFRANVIEPTREGGEFAWLTGAWVTAGGKPVRGMISHLHCPEGQRSEFANIGYVEVFV